MVVYVGYSDRGTKVYGSWLELNVQNKDKDRLLTCILFESHYSNHLPLLQMRIFSEEHVKLYKKYDNIKYNTNSILYKKDNRS